jgi:elongation factor 1-beta
MGKVIVTMKVMPDRPDVDLQKIGTEIKKIIEQSGEFGRLEVQPVAFGLKALVVYFIIPDTSGGASDIESKIKEIPGVQSVEVTDVRRAL